jgi:hypothetical protein
MTQVLHVNGETYSDDGTVGKGMSKGGFRENLFPMFSDTIVDLDAKVAAAADQVSAAEDQVALANSAAATAAAAAATVVTGPGSNGTSTTSLTAGLGVQNLVIQTGKTLPPGAPVGIAITASPRNCMYGTVDSYNSATGALQANIKYLELDTPGTFPTASAWTVFLCGTAGVTGVLNELKGAPIASAATVNLNAATGNYLHLTGSTGPVTAVTLAQGAERKVVLDSTPTFVHSSTLLLPTLANVIGQVGDVITFRGEGGGVTKVVGWHRANGESLFVPRQFRTLAHLASSGTWVAPAKGLLRITLRGADGSGAVALCLNDAVSSAVASGGAAGGLSIKTLRVEAGDAFVATLASGGAQVSTTTPGSRVNGNPGGTSTITGPGVSMTANGGNGGNGTYAASGAASAAGATGGTASGGDVNYTGGNSGTAAVTGVAGVAATGGGAVAWNGVGYSSGNATVSASSGTLGAASGGAGAGGASGAATVSSSTSTSTGGAGAAGPSASATNSVGAAGPGMPSGMTGTPLSLVGAGNSVQGGAGGNAAMQASSSASSTAGGQLAGGGGVVVYSGNVAALAITAVGGQGGSTGGAAARWGGSNTHTVTAQAGANAFAIFEFTEA